MLYNEGAETPKMPLRAWSLAALVAVLAGGAAHADVWAPGASAEPWPLIAQLQRAGAGDDRWRQALAHRDPLVRAAAVWAAGRARVPRGADRLRATTFDPDPLVRDASLWALLQSEDRAAPRILWDALAVRRQVTVGGRSSTIRSVGEPPAGFSLLFRRRGLPFFDGDVAARREWLALVPPEVSEVAAAWMPPAPVRWTSWTVERSEWDAGERVAVRATVEVERPGRDGASFEPPETTLAALDEASSNSEGGPTLRRIPVRLQLGATPVERSAAAAGGRVEVTLQLSLAEIPPGVYALEPFDVGHPLLLRVRRTPAREADVQAAAAAARSDEEIATVARQRVASQAERWRSELAPKLQPPGGQHVPAPTLPAGLLAALGALHDGAAAGLLVDALSTEFPPSLARKDVAAQHALVRAFGDAALPHLERAAAGWRTEIGYRGSGQFGLSVLGAVSLQSATLDDLRVEVLRELAPRVIAPPPPRLPSDPRYRSQPGEFRVRPAFFGSLVAVAARRPLEAGRALAALQDRPGALAAALKSFDPPEYTRYPYAADLDGVPAMLEEAWRGLTSAADADSRAAIAAEAERLSVALPGMERAAPASAAEAVREIERTRSRHAGWPPEPWEGPSRTLRRVLSSGLAEQEWTVARATSRLARELGLAGEALRLSELAVRQASSAADRAEALVVRSEALADAGEAGRALADLEEASPNVPAYARTSIAERRTALAGAPSGLRVRSVERRLGGDRVAFGRDGPSVFLRGPIVVRRESDGAPRVFGVAPFDVALAAPAGARAVAVLSATGTLGLLREGRPGLGWRVSGAGATDVAVPSQIAADERTVLVRDAKDVVHAFDAGTGRPLWTLPSDRVAPLALRDGDPVVLATPAPLEPGALVLAAFDPRTGRAVWTRPLARRGTVHALRIADGRAAWYAGDGTLTQVDVRTGRTAFSVALPMPAPAFPGTALALVPGSTKIVVALSDRLLAVDGGEILWSRDLPTGGYGESQALEVGEDGTVWRVFGQAGRVVAEARDRSGETVAAHRFVNLGGFSTAIVEGRTLVVSDLQRRVTMDRVTP
jgi:putative pyrroloquinoline-quinone binding quinoprotein/HEAT repeat protein